MQNKRIQILRLLFRLYLACLLKKKEYLHTCTHTLSVTVSEDAGGKREIYISSKKPNNAHGLCNRPPLIWRHIQVYIPNSPSNNINILSDVLKVNFLFLWRVRKKGGKAGVRTAAVYLFYEPTAVAADLTGIVHLFSVVGGGGGEQQPSEEPN